MSDVDDPRPGRKHPAAPDAWYKRYPRKFYDDTRDLKPDERGIYSEIIDLIYMDGKPLLDDDHAVAHRLYVDPRVWRRIRKRLLALGKIYLVNGCIHNRRAKQILRDRESSKKAMGSRPNCGGSYDVANAELSRSCELAIGDLLEMCNDSNAPERASSTEEDNKRREKKKEHIIVGDARAHEGVLVRLDDHRPGALTEEHFVQFRDLCDTFGRKPGSMVIAPTPREDSDNILRGVLKSELQDSTPEIALAALEASMRAAQAKTIDSRQSGDAGKGQGGINPLLGYIGKAIKGHAARLRIAQASERAQAMTEQAVQTKLAKKRLDGVDKPGGSRNGLRKGKSSWEDIASDMGLDLNEAEA
jgi:uncharacterized protein YdaU (DUF1376 family)